MKNPHMMQNKKKKCDSEVVMENVHIYRDNIWKINHVRVTIDYDFLHRFDERNKCTRSIVHPLKFHLPNGSSRLVG